MADELPAHQLWRKCGANAVEKRIATRQNARGAPPPQHDLCYTFREWRRPDETFSADERMHERELPRAPCDQLGLLDRVSRRWSELFCATCADADDRQPWHARACGVRS